MEILLIHQAFVSPKEAGGTRHYEIGQHLVKGGHGFSIIASNLSYLSGKTVAAESSQSADGITIIRANTKFLFPSGK